jgi:hypothetical protein
MTSLDATSAKRFDEPVDAATLDKVADALRERGHDVKIVETVAEARDLVIGMLPSDAAIFTAVSNTLTTSGIAAEIDESGRYLSVRKQLVGLHPLSMEARRLGAAPDVAVGSVQAITEDGKVVVVSATGSQLGPYAASAGRVVWVVGAQKIVPDLETAMRRIREHCLPLESERCERVYGRPSRINKTLIVDAEYPDRSTVVLVAEPIGF